MPENGNLVRENSIPCIDGTAWKLLTAADEGRGLVQAALFLFPDYSELITLGTVVLGLDETSDSE